MQGMLWTDMTANSANVAPAAAKKTNAYRPREGEKLLEIEACILQVNCTENSDYSQTGLIFSE
jgi:hypothetical protein